MPKLRFELEPKLTFTCDLPAAQTLLQLSFKLCLLRRISPIFGKAERMSERQRVRIARLQSWWLRCGAEAQKVLRWSHGKCPKCAQRCKCATVQLCIPLLRELLENVQNSNGQSQLFDANIKSESGPKYFTDVLDFCVHLTFV